MTSPHHKCPRHRWGEDDAKVAAVLAFQGISLPALAKHFGVTEGAMILFCKRRGIKIHGYGRAQRISDEVVA